MKRGGFFSHQEQSQQQKLRLVMLPKMQQALKILQQPITELVESIEKEMETNPILEYSEEKQEGEKEQAKEKEQEEVVIDDNDFEIFKKLEKEYQNHFSQAEGGVRPQSLQEEKYENYKQSLIQGEETLYHYLLRQAKINLSSQKEIEVAKILIGYLNDKGYLENTLEEIALEQNIAQEDLAKVLKKIQTFEPFGVGAKNLQQCFLIQLSCLKKKHTLAYQIIENHFDDLLHNKIPYIAKSLNVSKEKVFKTINQTIAKLTFHPGLSYGKSQAQTIVPDILLHFVDGKFIVETNEKPIPFIRINPRYLKLLEKKDLQEDEKKYVLEKIQSAKWLIRNIDKRNSTLKGLGQFLLEKQKAFFSSPEGKLVPMTFKEAAHFLEVHESTVARVVANKYLATPRGVKPLRFFFTNAYKTDKGEELSSETVREALQKLIEQEDKRKPYSDQKLSDLLKEKGIFCARRTVAKYREKMQIGNTRQRKKYV